MQCAVCLATPSTVCEHLHVLRIYICTYAYTHAHKTRHVNVSVHTFGYVTHSSLCLKLISQSVWNTVVLLCCTVYCCMFVVLMQAYMHAYLHLHRHLLMQDTTHDICIFFTYWNGCDISPLWEWSRSVHCVSCYSELVHSVSSQVLCSVPHVLCCAHHCTVAALLSVLHFIAHYLTILLPLGRRGPRHCEGVGGGGDYGHFLGRCSGFWQREKVRWHCGVCCSMQRWNGTI